MLIIISLNNSTTCKETELFFIISNLIDNTPNAVKNNTLLQIDYPIKARLNLYSYDTD